MAIAKRVPRVGRRSYTRFNPDKGAVAWIDLKGEGKGFKPTLPGLILNESFSGCAVIILDSSKLEKGDIVKVQAGKLPVLRAEVRWKKKSKGGQIAKLGLSYLE